MTVVPASGAIALAPQALPPAGVDVVAQAGVRGSAWLEQAVAPALESDRALQLRRYRLPLS
jgi:hypothetical protein